MDRQQRPLNIIADLFAVSSQMPGPTELIKSKGIKSRSGLDTLLLTCVDTIVVLKWSGLLGHKVVTTIRIF